MRLAGFGKGPKTQEEHDEFVNSGDFEKMKDGISKYKDYKFEHKILDEAKDNKIHE
jgi:hypothetical protein